MKARYGELKGRDAEERVLSYLNDQFLERVASVNQIT